MGSAHARLISGFIPLVIACTGDSVSPPPSVATIFVSLTAASVQVGGATQALAVLRDATGNVLTGRTVAWNSLAPSVATVSPTGVVTGVSPGLAQIRATSETVSGEGTLQVTAVPVAAAVVTLAQSSIGVGATTQASATLRDAS